MVFFNLFWVKKNESNARSKDYKSPKHPHGVAFRMSIIYMLLALLFKNMCSSSGFVKFNCAFQEIKTQTQFSLMGLLLGPSIVLASVSANL